MVLANVASVDVSVAQTAAATLTVGGGTNTPAPATSTAKPTTVGSGATEQIDPDACATRCGEYVPQSIIDNGGYYKSPVIPWQYTLNAAIYYDFSRYQIRVSGYSITNQHNLTSDYSFYGNDFITRATPASVDLTLRARF